MALALEPGAEAGFAERLDSIEKALMNIVALSAKELESQNHRLDLLQWTLAERQQPAEPVTALAAPQPAAEGDALAAMCGRVGALEQSLDSLSSTLELEFTIMRHFMSGGQLAGTTGSDASPNGALRSPAPRSPQALVRHDHLEARFDAMQSALGSLSQRHSAEVEAAREAVAALDVASGKAKAQVGRLEASLINLADHRAADIKRVERLESLAGPDFPAFGRQPADPQAAASTRGDANGTCHLPEEHRTESRTSISVFAPGATAGVMVHEGAAQDDGLARLIGGS